MKRLRFAFLLFALLFSACASDARDCVRTAVVCVGLVTDTGGLQDYGLTQSAWADIQRAQSEGRVQYSAYIESVDARDYGKNIESFARGGYDLILSAGIGLRELTLQAADLYPATVFIGLDQPPDHSRPNFIAITFPEDRAGFLAGALAAQMTETGIIGAVCETSGILSNWRACEGFRAGAHYEDAEVDVLVEYRDNGSQESLFRDREWGQAAAVKLIRNGVDVIFGVGGGTGQGALVTAAEQGVYAIGSEQDQYFVTREAQAALLTSLFKRAAPAVYDLISLLRSEDAPAAEYSGTIAIAPFHEQEQRIPEQVKADLMALGLELSRHMIDTGIPAQPPE